jgi:DNA-binding transcriptional ArsR family regulator
MEPSGYRHHTAAERLDATFAALADPTRRAILARLCEGEASVTELAAPFDISQPAISKHLRVLERAGLVTRSRDAQRRPVHVEVKPLADASAWIDEYRRVLEANFARLDTLLESLKRERGIRPRIQAKRRAHPGAHHPQHARRE